jgi:RNA polymerase sigma-54 factor
MLKPALQLKLGQRQAMTPQLQQAIRLLQLTALELQQTVRDSLAENVLLELEDGAEDFDEAVPTEATASREDGESDADPIEDPWAENHSGPSAGDSPWSEDDRSPEYADPSGGSLQEHLLDQLVLARRSPREETIGRAIIDAINDDGYLTDSLDTLVDVLRPDLEATVEQVESVLRTVQTFDPAGVGARSIGECIELQLAQLAHDTPGLVCALYAVRDHLPHIASGDHSTLRRELGVSVDEWAQAYALIRGCHPRPGNAIQNREPEFIVPDVVVTKRSGSWVVELNSTVVPKLRVNVEYAALVTREHVAMRAQLQEARWLIKSIEMRNDTLLKVAKTLVHRQSAFLEQGDEAMEPLVLREIADAVQMHESTISRVTTGKYMLTPRGTYEFRHFFSSHVSAADGTEVSSTAIRAKIKKLIAGESPDNPLSDSRIAEILASDGAKVARRTVAKYREAMRIAPSSERRTTLAR